MPSDGALAGTRVLIAHTSPDVRAALRDALAATVAGVAEAGTGGDALTALRGERSDVLLLDHRLADALPAIKRDPELFGTAVVLVGEPPDVGATLRTLELGAHDVLRDDPSPAEVVARVHAAHRAHEMQVQLLRREHDLEALAYRDELTAWPTGASPRATTTR